MHISGLEHHETCEGYPESTHCAGRARNRYCVEGYLLLRLLRLLGREDGWGDLQSRRRGRSVAGGRTGEGENIT